MPITDPSMLDVEEDLSVPANRAARLRKLADVLRKNVGQEQPQGQMVSGRFIAPHLGQMLNPLAQDIRATLAENRAGRAEDQSAAAQSAAAQQWQSNFPRAIPGAQQMGPTEDGSQMPSMPATPVTREQVLKHTLAGMRNPLTAHPAELYAREAEKGITADEIQETRRSEGEANRVAQADRAQADRLARIEAVKAKIEQDERDGKRTDEMRRFLATTQAQATQYAADARADAMRYGADARSNKGTVLKNLPAAQSGAYTGNASTIKDIDDAMKAVQENPNAFGLQFGISDEANQRLDPKGVGPRAKVANIGSLKIHSRAGSATTASETPRLKPFIPAVHNDPKAILDKLKELRAEAERHNDSIIEFATTQNYKSPGMHSGKNVIASDLTGDALLQELTK